MVTKPQTARTFLFLLFLRIIFYHNSKHIYAYIYSCRSTDPRQRKTPLVVVEVQGRPRRRPFQQLASRRQLRRLITTVNSSSSSLVLLLLVKAHRTRNSRQQRGNKPLFCSFTSAMTQLFLFCSDQCRV